MSSIELKLKAETKPWYSYRMVWLMLGLPFIVVLASFYTLYLSIKTDDGLIDTNYYQDGLAVNQLLAKDDKAKALDLVGLLDFKGATVSLSLKGGKNAALAGVPIKLIAQNIGVKAQDQTVTLVPDGQDKWKGQLNQPLAIGVWQVRLEAQDWRLVQTVKGNKINAPVAFGKEES